MKKRALITGITGQDGSYLAEFLLNKDYEVHGIKRRSSSFNTTRLDHIFPRIHLHYGDMTDSMCLIRLINAIQPDEIYNLAAQSHVRVSFDTPEYTAQADGLGTLRLLEAIQVLKLQEKTKFYQASTSELFGGITPGPYHEHSPFYPRSPYAVAKLYAHWITINYREAYNIFACNGILFNHESPRRGETFVTRKITRAVAHIQAGLQEVLYLGNLDARRDWGYAPDYVQAMWLMLQQEKPDDFVIATGTTHTVREFIEHAFLEIGINLIWQGTGIDTVGINSNTGKKHILIDKAYFRPTEVPILQGNATKAQTILGWKPTIDFHTLVKIMVEHDCTELNKAPTHLPEKLPLKIYKENGLS